MKYSNDKKHNISISSIVKYLKDDYWTWLIHYFVMLSHIVTLSLMICTKNGLFWSETRKTFVLEVILRNGRYECDYLMAKENKRLNLSIWYSVRNTDMSLMKSWMGCIIIPVIHDILITTLSNELRIIE